MNAEEALKALKEGKTLGAENWYGDFTWTGSEVFFSCNGEYPCCHDWMDEKSFLEMHKNDIFNIKE